jgi:kynurenine formamidase
VSATLLAHVVSALDDGSLRIVDLTQPLGAETPVIGLPPIFAASPGVTIDVISEYDERGPAWYWNTLRFGEHTGTHFDAPIHWVTGRHLAENACDTIPARRLVGPACVIDVRRDVARDPDFLLTVERIEAWEGEHGRIPAGAWLLLCTGWLQTDPSALTSPPTAAQSGVRCGCVAALAHDRDVLGVGVETIGTDAGRPGRSTRRFPITRSCTAPEVRSGEPGKLDRLPPTGAIVIAAPLKIVRGSGSPVRVLAISPI